MPMYAPVPEGGHELIPPPAGTHVAICYRLVDLGTQQIEFQGERKLAHKIMLSWELPDERMEDGTPFSLHQRYTLSMHEKATLRKHLESWRGQSFTNEEAAKFDISSVLGKPCLVSVVHNLKNGRTYANIASVSRMPKGMIVPHQVNRPTFFTLAEPDWGLYDQFSESLKGIIAKSPEYAEARKANVSEAPAHSASSDLDDEIPF